MFYLLKAHYIPYASSLPLFRLPAYMRSRKFQKIRKNIEVVGLSLTSVFLIFFVSGEAKTADNGQNRCTWHG